MNDNHGNDDQLVGQVFRGYELTRQIGVGGFGAVYRAYQKVVDREVAVKIIHDRYAKKADFVRRFEAEARTVARLEHPYIVPLYDYWREPQGAYLVMRYLRGGSARSMLEDHGPWPIDSVVQLLDQVAQSLAVAHQYGVIHRDIKPENILLDENNNAYLSDFGISVNIFTDPEDVLIENLSFGSPAYMAPEQLIRRTVTPLADIYSMGILLFELLTNELPFDGDTTAAIAQKHARAPIPKLSQKRSDLPSALDAIIERATAKTAGARYQDVLMLAAAFKEAARPAMGQGELPRSKIGITGLMDMVPPGASIPLNDTRDYNPGQGTIDFDSQSVSERAGGGTLALNPDVLPDAPEPSDRIYEDDDAAFDVSSREVATSDAPKPDGTIDFTDTGSHHYEPSTLNLDETETGPLTPRSTLDLGTEPFTSPAPDLYEDEDAFATGKLPEPSSSGTMNFDTARLYQQNVPGTLDFNVGSGMPVRNPYKGLRPFEEFDALDFHGRSEFVNQLVQHFAVDDRRFLALIGPSGSGKSSVVKAGLIPRLRAGGATGSDRWFIIATVLSADPYQELAEALLRVALDEPVDLKERLQTDPDVLHRIVNDILPDMDTELLLFIDQFEELFTLVDDDRIRAAFLQTLTQAVTAPNSRIRVIITLRADFYDRPLQYKAFAELMTANTQTVLPLSSSELREAVTGPAIQAGLFLPDELATRIVDAIAEDAGALPLLQYALTELYERRDGNRLSVSAYNAIGGVSGALARRADEIYQGLDSEDDQQLVRQLFLRLITLEDGPNARATRRRVLWNELFSGIGDRKRAQAIIDAFAGYRLLTLDRDPTTRSPTVEIAHESLITAWDDLQTWITENRDELRRRERLRIATAEWTGKDRDNSFLARGARLAEFETLLSDKALPLSEDETAYVKAGVALRRRGLRIAQGIAAGFAVLAIFALVFAALALDREEQAQRAESEAVRNAEISRSRELAASGLAILQQTDLALLLGVEAARTADTVEARNTLLNGLQSNPFMTRYLNTHNARVNAVNYSEDGAYLLTVDNVGGLVVWDAATGAIHGDPLPSLHDDAIYDAVFSPDGAQILTASADGTAHTLSVDDLDAAPASLYSGTAELWAAAYHPDGIVAALGADDGRVTLIDMDNRALLQSIETGAGHVYAVAFSPDGTVLATGGDDNRVHLWDTTTWEAIGDPLEVHTGWVLTLAFNANGLLASAGVDRTLAFWQVNEDGGTLIDQVATPHTDWIRDLAFTGDGLFLASASHDGDIRMWSADSRQQALDPLRGNTGQVWGVAFQPDSLALTSGTSADKAIQWAIALPARPGRSGEAATGPVTALAAAGDVLAVGSGNGKLTLFDASSDDPPNTLQYDLDAHEGEITALTFDPTGTQMITIGQDLQGRVWDAGNGALLTELPLEDVGLVRAILFVERDGVRQLITAGDADFIHFRDPQSGDALRDPIPIEQSGTFSLALHSSGHWLFAGGRDGTIQRIDLTTDVPTPETIAEHNDAVTAMVFGADGETLATAGRDRNVILWGFDADGVPTGERRVLRGHADWVNELALRADGRTLASAGRDNTVILWDVISGRMLGRPLLGHTAEVTGLAFTGDGTRLFAGEASSAILAWETDPAVWIEQACALANRNFTPVEWAVYFPDQPYRDTCN